MDTHPALHGILECFSGVILGEVEKKTSELQMNIEASFQQKLTTTIETSNNLLQAKILKESGRMLTRLHNDIKKDINNAILEAADSSSAKS